MANNGSRNHPPAKGILGLSVQSIIGATERRSASGRMAGEEIIW